MILAYITNRFCRTKITPHSFITFHHFLFPRKCLAAGSFIFLRKRKYTRILAKIETSQIPRRLYLFVMQARAPRPTNVTWNKTKTGILRWKGLWRVMPLPKRVLRDDTWLVLAPLFLWAPYLHARHTYLMRMLTEFFTYNHCFRYTRF